MSELIQVKKQLTLEDIAPNWARSISMGEYNRDELNQNQYCVVGEAHGYDFRYNCSRCTHYSMSIFFSVYYMGSKELKEDLTDHKQELDNFVEHWNECHVKSP